MGGFKKDGSLRRRLHAPRLGRELDVAARLPVVLGLRALPEHAHPQVAGVHLPVAGADDDADVADLRGASKIEKETTHDLLSRRRRMTMKGKHHNTTGRRDRAVAPLKHSIAAPIAVSN